MSEKGSTKRHKQDTRPGSQTSRSEMEYFRSEKERLEKEFNKTLERMEKDKPQQKMFVPDVYNSLEAYGDLTMYNKALDGSDETPRGSHSSRNTAIRLCDPWVSLEMDTKFRETIDQATERTAHRDTQQQQQQQQQQRQQRRDSTRSTNKQQMSSDSNNNKRANKTRSEQQQQQQNSPVVRDEIAQEIERHNQKCYELTKREFYRRKLHNMEDYGPETRQRMREAYFAYLQNTAGSSKAVRECVQEAEQDMEEKKNEKGKDKGKEGRDNIGSGKKSGGKSGKENNKFDAKE